MSAEEKDDTELVRKEFTVGVLREMLTKLPDEAPVYALDGEDDWAALDVHIIKLPRRGELRTFVIMVPRPYNAPNAS